MSLKEKLTSLQLKPIHYISLGIGFLLIVLYQIISTVYFKPAVSKEIPLVRTITIGSSKNSGTLTYPGEVRGRYESNLAFQVPGKIVRRNISLGDVVHAGQILMELDPKDISQAVSANSAELEAALSQFKLAQDNAERYSQLYANGAVSKSTMEQYQNQATVAAATVQQARAHLTGSSNQLGYTQLIADHDGVVAAINGEVGQITAAGTPIVTVVRDGQREIQFYVPESHLQQIKIGQKASVTFWAVDKLTVNGTISEISPTADPVMRTYKARITLNELPLEVKLGMTAKVALSSGMADAIAIPGNAIYQTDDTPKVWLVKNKKVTLIPVEVGGYNGNNINISAGLQNGDVVVIGGVNKLAEGQDVRLEAGVTE